MMRQEKTLTQLVNEINLLPQSLINLKTNHASKLADNPEVRTAVKSLESKLNAKGRVLLRPSGTEPLLR